MPDDINPNEPQKSPPQEPPKTIVSAALKQAKLSDKQPPKKAPIRLPPINLIQTQKILSQLESAFSQKVLSYYVPSGIRINQTHPDIFLDQLRRIGFQENLTLIVVSDGGDSSASLRIASIIREYAKNLNIVVPSRCASAATVLALAADKIIMCSSGYLTAIDTSVVHGMNPKGANGEPVSVSVDQIKRIIKFLNDEGPSITDNHKEGSYRTLFRYIHPLTIGEIDRISSRTILVATKMMKMHPQTFENEEKINWIAQHLYNDYPEHGFPILYEEAKNIGLPVEKADNNITDYLKNLVNLYDTSTMNTKTHFSENFYHEDYFTTTIESVGLRSTYHGSYDNRLNSVTKRWQRENDLSRWVNIAPPRNPEEKIILQPLDYIPTDDHSDVIIQK